MKRFLYLTILFFVLCSCGDDSEPLNSPPYVPDYSISLCLVDGQGEDASDRLPLSLAVDGSTVSYYKLPEEEFSWSCFIDGTEVTDSCVTDWMDVDWNDVTDLCWLEISKRHGEGLKKFTLRLKSSHISPQDYMDGNVHTFDYRFRCPLLFGNMENSLRIVAPATYFYLGKFDEATFNGIQVEHYNSVFKIMIDDE